MSRTQAKKTELKDAVYNGDVALVRQIIHEMDIKSLPLSGFPLHKAAERGHVGVADVLLKAGVDVNGVTALFGDTPLHMAAEWGHFGVAELLIKHGADMQRKNVSGKTPFGMATLRGHDRVAKLLKPETPMDSEDQARDLSPIQESLPKGAYGGRKEDQSFSRSIGPEGGKLQTTSCTVIVPPGAVIMETEITCGVINPNDITVSLTDGDMLVSDIIELGPHGTTLHKPATVRMRYHSTSSSGDREPVVRDMSQWRELKTTEKGKENIAVTVDQFSTLAVISKLKHDQFSVSTEGCTLTSSTQPAVQLTFPEQSVNTPTQVKLQVQDISKHELDKLKAKNPSSRSLICASPIVKIGVADQSSFRFNKPVTVQAPHPRHYMGVSGKGASKLHVTSCEEGADEWTDVTHDVNMRDFGKFVEFNVTKTASHIILDVQIGGESEEIGPIPLAICDWIHQHDAQFTLLQREDNPKHIIIECSKASDADDRVTRVGYKVPDKSNIVRLCEGQKVEINLKGNVSFADFDTADKHITFHSHVKYDTWVNTLVMGKKDNFLEDLDGEGLVTFHALPRVALRLNAQGGREVCSALKKKQEPEEHLSSTVFLCQLPIKVPMTRQLEDQLQEGVSSREPKGVAKYFYFIKEEVISTEWMDLAHFLGFTWADRINIRDMYADSKTRCWCMLEQWRQREGNAATIEVLMEALSEAKLQSVVDGLRKKFPDLQEQVGVKK